MSERRRPGRSGLFRGSELATLLLLGAIVVVGWPVILSYARPKAAPAPAPAPSGPGSTVANLSPIVPDSGIEFEALIDKTTMTSRDNPAYQILLQRIRDTKPADLRKAARRDVLFTHLLERPERYRGVPVHLDGTVLRVLTYEVNPALAPSGRLFEAWLYSDENRRFPYVVIFEEPPAKLPIGPDVRLRVSFDGYFLKLLRYVAGDSARAAPLLVGRLRWEAPAPGSDRSASNWHGLTGRNAVYLVLALAAVYLGARIFFAVRRYVVPKRRPSSLARDDAPPPGDVADWLRNLPDDEDDKANPARPT